MRMLDLIEKKRDGASLTKEEIVYIVEGYTKETIPDYQMASFLMAVYFKGMTQEETLALTMAMAHSGRTIDLSAVPGVKVDKHSTGGVADTTTLVVLPLAAAAGVKVAKMSGRGLGFTGGTIDKLEAIPGFQATLTQEAFIAQLRVHGMAITGQSGDLAPADGKIYALRDVTATVASIPLIASSIMSKKIAAGADKILLDVKVGSGAFMRDLDSAIRLAQAMVAVGTLAGKETRALLTSMEEPLGSAIGNSMEVKEAIEILSGKGDGALREVCLTLGAHLLEMAGAAATIQIGYQRLETLLNCGAGLEKFRTLVAAQQGDPAYVDDPSLLASATHALPVCNVRKGYVHHMDVAELGNAAALLGAGRMFKGQEIDLSVGIMMQCRIGDFLHEGDVFAIVQGNDWEKMREAEKRVLHAVHISDEQAKAPSVILGVVDASGFHAPLGVDLA